MIFFSLWAAKLLVSGVRVGFGQYLNDVSFCFVVGYPMRLIFLEIPLEACKSDVIYFSVIILIIQGG